jgi:hypothetical protein
VRTSMIHTGFCDARRSRSSVEVMAAVMINSLIANSFWVAYPVSAVTGKFESP